MKQKGYFLGVKFHGNDKSYYFSCEDPNFMIGDLVVVQTVSGYEIGTVSTAAMDLSNYKSNLELKPIIRKPTPEDIKDYEFTLEQAKKAIKITQDEVDKLALPMRLLDAEYNLDGSKITITYTADNRVDFRELLKNLAPLLRCRIELKQIATRDKAKMVGGIGICGLPLCCSSFLSNFEGISINRAKNQMLTLNIPKLSGPCNKLNCCLIFEDDVYTEAKKDFPHLGQTIKDSDGDWTVSGMNVISRTVKLNNSETVKFVTLEEYNEMSKKKFDKASFNKFKNEQ